MELVRLDPQYRLVFEGGGALAATSDISRMEQEVARLNEHDSQQFRRYLQDNREKLERFRPILESPFNSALDLLRPAVLRALSKLRPGRCVDADLGRFFQDQRIRLAFSFQSKYLGMSPFQCPSLFTILSYLEYEYGVWHPIGGCGAVTQSMARICREMGVEIRLGEAVEGLLFNGRRAVGVRTPSGEHVADAVVVNGEDFHEVLNGIEETLKEHFSIEHTTIQLETESREEMEFKGF